jgi:Protein of unknown function (DUF3179)
MANVIAEPLVARGGRARRRLAWAGLLLLVAAALALVLIPAWVIYPFKAQTRAGLELSYTLRRWSPWGTLAAVLGASALVVWLWRGSHRRWAKALLVVALVPVLAAAWFARQNHFEWMFRPLAGAAYASAGDASFVSDTDMVLAVEINGDAVAYPVRQMAYHHLVPDVVGGKPVVSTY